MRYVVTGATGFLGKKLVPALLNAGHDVILIVRSKHDKTAEARVYAHFLDEGITDQHERIAIIESDIEQHPKTLAEQIRAHGPVDGVWHLAANLSFKPEHRAGVLADNLGGTQNIADVCERLGATLFFVSTAFVHGNRVGLIQDTELVRPQRFNNSYEESKYLCESFIVEWGKRNSYLIFRPGILISLKPGQGSYFGYYVIAHALKKLNGRLTNHVLRHPRLMRMFGFVLKDDVLRTPLLFPTTNCAMDFVPVEWVVQWMLRISDGPDRNTAFHLSNPHPIPIVTLVRVVTAASKLRLMTYHSSYRLTTIYFNALALLGHVSRILASFSRKIIPYRFYVTASFIHDMSRTAARVGDLSAYTVSEQTLLEIAAAYVRDEPNRDAL